MVLGTAQNRQPQKASIPRQHKKSFWHGQSGRDILTEKEKKTPHPGINV